MPPALNIIALATFSAALSARALDPVLPHVAEDFSISIATAASFAAVFAFTFAIIQPVLGAMADLFGKARLMIVCLVLLGLANVLGALSTSFPLLFATRILAGIGSGGVFPIALGLTSDLVGPEKRQVAIGRTLAGAMTGNLLGASASGIIGDFLGWRGVLAVLGLLVVVASVAVAVGGLFYTLSVSRFLPRLGVNGMMIAGAALVGLQLAAIAFGPAWKIQAVSMLFMGWGFYMIHGSLQVFASELSVEARATALSLHSFFFFMGQTIGPVAYGLGLGHAGKVPTLLGAAVVMIALRFVCARLLRQRAPADAVARTARADRAIKY